MKFLLTFVLIVTSVLACSQTKEKTSGEIKGTVTDFNGNLVPGATVCVVPQDISFENIAPRSVTANALGQFDFHGGFALGTYKLYAKKESDGYPDPSDTFYADPKREPITVELTKEHPSSTATVALLDRAAVLAGSVVDADSRVPLKAKLVLMDEDGNSHSVMVTGKYRTLVPPGRDMTLMVDGDVPKLRFASSCSYPSPSVGARDGYGHPFVQEVVTALLCSGACLRVS